MTPVIDSFDWATLEHSFARERRTPTWWAAEYWSTLIARVTTHTISCDPCRHWVAERPGSTGRERWRITDGPGDQLRHETAPVAYIVAVFALDGDDLRVYDVARTADRSHEEALLLVGELR